MTNDKHSLSMADRVKLAIRDTKEYFNKAYPQITLTDEDFSYITAELLEYYDKYAQPKDEQQALLASAAGLKSSFFPSSESARASDPALLESWTYYGHHVVLNGSTARASFINDNNSTGPDSPSNRCWGTHAWTASYTGASPSSSCPSNSQGYNSYARGIR